MRRGVLMLLCCAAARVFAQEQEGKLLDRLLKPDMTLANNAQDKQFVGVRQTTAKSVSTRKFGGVHEKPAKEYGGQRPFFARLFNWAREFPRSHTASLATRSDVPQKTFTTRESPVRASRDAEKTVASNDYPGERPFITRGKSQKSLDAQRHQMSIDEVRELLNRNK